MKGFSPRNLKYMRSFAEAYTGHSFVQQVAAQIPWFHNCTLLDKVSDPKERQWYLKKTIEHGWGRNILSLQIESRLFQRQDKVLTLCEIKYVQNLSGQKVIRDLESKIRVL